MIKTFDEIFEDRTKYGTKLKTDEYQEQGRHLIVDQGQKSVAGYTDLEDGLFEDVPAIIFGDHTRIVKYIDSPFFIGADGVKIIKSKITDANYKYLYYALKNAKIPDTGYNRHFKWLKELRFEYHNLEEQQKIVDVLEKVERVIVEQKQNIERLDALIKSRFVEMFSRINNYKTIEELCSIITDGTHQPPEFQTEGIPFIFVSNITGNKITYEAEKFISEETYNELIKRTPIEIGDILLSTVGSYGHPAIVTESRRFLFQRHIAYLKPCHEIVDSFYMHGALLSPDAQKQIEEKVKGIAQKTLNLSEIRKISIPVPNLREQKEFKNFVHQVDKLKVATQKNLEKTQLLFDSLIQQYFG